MDLMELQDYAKILIKLFIWWIRKSCWGLCRKAIYHGVIILNTWKQICILLMVYYLRLKENLPLSQKCWYINQSYIVDLSISQLLMVTKSHVNSNRYKHLKINFLKIFNLNIRYNTLSLYKVYAITISPI